MDRVGPFHRDYQAWAFLEVFEEGDKNFEAAESELEAQPMSIEQPVVVGLLAEENQQKQTFDLVAVVAAVVEDVANAMIEAPVEAEVHQDVDQAQKWVCIQDKLQALSTLQEHRVVESPACLDRQPQDRFVGEVLLAQGQHRRTQG